LAKYGDSANSGRGVEQRRDLAAGAQDLRRQQPQQWTRPSQHGAARRDQAVRLQRRLGTAGRHHAGQGPTGNRERPLEGTGGDDDPSPFDQPGPAGDRDADDAMRIEAPHHGPIDDRRTARPGLGRERLAHPVVVAQDRPVGDRARGDGAVDLAADAGVLVEQEGREPGARADRRGGKPRRPAADHDEVVDGQEVGGVHRRVLLSVLLPSAAGEVSAPALSEAEG